MPAKDLCLGVSHPGRILAVLMALAVAPASAREAGTSPFVVVNRTIIQDQGDWQVDYRFRYDGATGLDITADELTAQVEGWVSNSRAPGHALPRWSSLTIRSPS